MNLNNNDVGSQTGRLGSGSFPDSGGAFAQNEVCHSDGSPSPACCSVISSGSKLSEASLGEDGDLKEPPKLQEQSISEDPSILDEPSRLQERSPHKPIHEILDNTTLTAEAGSEIHLHADLALDLRIIASVILYGGYLTTVPSSAPSQPGQSNSPS